MSRGEDTARAARLRWCLRAYGSWMVVVPIFAAVALILVPPGDRYEAEAVVYVRGLQVSSKALPPLADAVFNGGVVQRAVAAGVPEVADAGSLSPARLELTVVEDSVVFLVAGRDADPAIATAIANTAAPVFAEELNRAGPDVGIFAVQSDATVPANPLPAADPVWIGAAGGLVGLLIVLGGIGLVAVVRRPVVGAADIEALLGTCHLGTVRLPPPRSGAPLSLRAPGVAPVVRKLASATGVVLVLSDARDGAVRQRVVVLLAVALTRTGTTRVSGPAPVRAAIETELGHDIGAAPGSPAAGELVLVDGPETRSTFGGDQRSPGVVLVARRGAPRARLSAMAVGYTPADLLGVILVEVRRPRWSERPAAPKPASAAVQQAGAAR